MAVYSFVRAVYIVDLHGDKVSLIQSGDKGWNLVNGVLDQDSVNLIGQAINDYFRSETE